MTAGSGERPTLVITVNGSHNQLSETIVSRVDEIESGKEVDVFFRLTTSGEKAETGVLAITDRVTGNYLLECRGSTDTMRKLIQAVREQRGSTNEPPQYTVQICTTEGDIKRFTKERLPVYDADGTLLRRQSIGIMLGM